MPNSCSVVNCRSHTTENVHGELHFFSLPKEEERALKWIRFSGQETVDKKNFRICSQHFSKCDIWKYHPRPLLIRTAVPSLRGPNELDVSSSNIKEEPSIFPGEVLDKRQLLSDTEMSQLSAERDIHERRNDYLEWDEYFMATAFLAAKRSKDPCTQVGACIVSEEKKVVGVGYNGMPTGCSDDEFPWRKNTNDKLESKYLYVCHAEMNAILNKNAADVKGCTIYVALFPCNECAKVIIQSGIKTVVYMSDKYAHKVEVIAAKRMFDAVGVTYRQYIPANKRIVIDFTEINWNEMTQLESTPVKKNDVQLCIQ